MKESLRSPNKALVETNEVLVQTVKHLSLENESLGVLNEVLVLE